MQKCILIRTYRDEDKLFCKKLLEASVMNQLNHTYIGFLLGLNIMRIVNILSIVLMSLLMYTGIHKIYCIIVIFIPEIILYISLYAKFLYEARIVGNEADEISRICTPSNSSRFWIAEAYEDLSVNNQEQDQPYIFMTQEKLNECNIDISQYNKKIVGIMSVCKSNWEPTVAWIKRLYVQKKYRRKGIGRQFINRAIHFAEEYRFECVKAIINEFQKVVIHFFNAKNFTLKIIRDQSYLMTIMMYEYTYLTRHSNQIS
ncbi:uncharacterized protein LOC118443644 isoform X1 [Vespa mandarinia]|uniref:uncharacterized protein LOC118443644 isoform X1 n=1 Tax=Vespa mandarinia TaxID=7446 RepID=UPI00161EB67E|nr:uncharacterized protein LOC118443644 isoform X1 [Vespa mandarinia]